MTTALRPLLGISFLVAVLITAGNVSADSLLFEPILNDPVVADDPLGECVAVEYSYEELEALALQDYEEEVELMMNSTNCFGFCSAKKSRVPTVNAVSSSFPCNGSSDAKNKAAQQILNASGAASPCRSWGCGGTCMPNGLLVPGSSWNHLTIEQLGGGMCRYKTTAGGWIRASSCSCESGDVDATDVIFDIKRY